MRRDGLYLDDIVEASEALNRFLAGVSEEAFLDSDLLQSAVLQKLTVIGEAAARLSPEIKTNAPYVPWSKIVAFRNLAVHAYFSVRWPIVWLTATQDTPLLREQVLPLLAAEQAEDDDSQTK